MEQYDHEACMTKQIIPWAEEPHLPRTLETIVNRSSERRAMRYPPLIPTAVQGVYSFPNTDLHWQGKI